MEKIVNFVRNIVKIKICIDMIIELNKHASKMDIRKAIQKIKNNIHHKKKNPFKYYGKLKMDIDPVKWQKKIRDEWD